MRNVIFDDSQIFLNFDNNCMVYKKSVSDYSIPEQQIYSDQVFLKNTLKMSI